MKLTPRFPLPSPLTTLLALAMLCAAADAMAQMGRFDPDERREHKVKAEDQQETGQFPGATRTSPHLKASKSGGKALKDIVEFYQAKQYPQTIQKADELAAASTSAYERGYAYQLAATAAADAGDNEKAAVYFKKALETDGLDNNDHYQVMYNLAVTQYQTKHYADALATLERLTSETKADTPEYAALKAGLLANMDRPKEAAALYEQQFARDPGNTRALMNAVAAYQKQEDFAKANALLAAAEKKGLLTEASQYRALYVGYINDNKPTEALATIDEGIAKGLLQPSPDLAQAYSVIAQDAYAAGDAATAIAMYQRAAPMAKDGEAALNLAKVLLNEQHTAQARQAAQQALDKGVKNPAEARKILGQSGK